MFLMPGGIGVVSHFHTEYLVAEYVVVSIGNVYLAFELFVLLPL
jgi:hypothetical protein